MKKLALKIIFSGAFIFSIGFYTGQKFNINNLPANHVTVSEKNNPSQKSVQTTAGLKEDPTQHQFHQPPAGKASVQNEDVFLPPHEQEISMAARMEREEQFKINQNTEIELYETMLVSMQENNFPQAEIDSVKNQIASIEAAKFVDSDLEQDDNAENMTIEKMRDDLTESLRQNTDLSNNEIETMVKSMFPDEDNENAGKEM